QVEQYNLAYSIERPEVIAGGDVSATWIIGGGQRNFREGAWHRAGIAAPVTRGGAGAWELALRYTWANVGPAFFQTDGLYDGWQAVKDADTAVQGEAVNAHKVQAWTWGVTWAADSYTRLMFNWVLTTTGSIGEAIKNHNKADESSYLLRLQVMF
ncbi:MAG: porin, partial [Gammaproteobacteria bacterium]|nr:porin [Gammaproteobacteria bacterium]